MLRGYLDSIYKFLEKYKLPNWTHRNRIWRDSQKEIELVIRNLPAKKNPCPDASTY